MLFTHDACRSHARHRRPPRDHAAPRRRRLPIYGPAETLDDLATKFRYIFDDAIRPLPGTSKPEGKAHPIEAGRQFSVADLEIMPVAVPHGAVTVFAYRIGPLAYVTDAKSLPAEAIALLRGASVLVINALFRTEHPTHLSIPEAVAAARDIGAERTYLTHLTHDNFHADLEAELPRGIVAGVRWAHRSHRLNMTLRIDFTNMMGDVVDGGIAAADWASAAEAFRGAHAGLGRRRERGELGFLVAADRRRAAPPVDRFRGEDPTASSTTSSCSASADRRSGPSRCAPRCSSRPGTRSTRMSASASRASTCSTTSIRNTIAALLDRLVARPRAVHRDIQVGRHGGDDGAVSRSCVERLKAQVARREAPPRLRHRSDQGRAPRDRERAKEFPCSTFRRRSAGDSAC